MTATKISALPAATTVAANDLLYVVTDPGGSPISKKITQANFFANVVSNTKFSNTVTFTKNITANTITFSDNTVIDSALTKQEVTLIDAANTYTALSADDIILVDCATYGNNVSITLPTTNAFEGKLFTVTNYDSGSNGYSVTVKSDTTNGSLLIQDPITGDFVLNYAITTSHHSETWVNHQGYYYHLNTQRNVPIFYTSANTYSQVVVKNASAGPNASSDLVLYNDQGDETAGTGPFIDIGINSSTYSNATYSIGSFSDAYVFNDGGDLAIGTAASATAIKLHAGGTTSADLKLTVNSTAVSVNTGVAFEVPLSTKLGSSAGRAGQICWDANYIYVCTSDGVWKRASLNSF